MASKVKSEEQAAEWADPESLLDWPDNPRKNDKNVANVKALILATAFGSALLARRANRMLIAGHTRKKAVLELKREGKLDKVKGCVDGKIPVRFIDVSQEVANRMALADNRLNELSLWDETKLLPQLEAMQVDEVKLLGWAEGDLDVMRKALQIAEHAGVDLYKDEDVIPEVSKQPVTKSGDVWILDRHKLVCGASGSAFVKSHIPQRVLSLVSDPPYCSGGFQEANRSSGSVGAKGGMQKKIANDRLSTRGYEALIRGVIEQVDPIDVHLFTDWKMWNSIYDSVSVNGITVRSMIMWAKPSPGMGQGWRSQHELVIYGHRGKPNITHKDSRGNVITCKRQKNELHTTQKPVEVMEELVKMADGEIVVDSFAGSGTTLIACENLERECLLVELDPAYCDVIVERWQRYTSKKARRSGSTIPPPTPVRKKRTSSQTAAE